MTDFLDRAIARTRDLPPDMQDEAARMLLLFAGEDEAPIQLTPEEESDLAEAEADRGGFATDEEVRAIFARHRASPPASRRPPPRYVPPMDRDQILARLRDHATDLRSRGVTRAALFGSVARGEARPDSDIDIMVELDHNVVRTLFDYAGVKLVIEDLFESPVDVVDREGLRSGIRPNVLRDAIYAF